MKGKIIASLMIAAMPAMSVIPGTAQAASETRARAAVAEAKGKIEANDQSGVTGSAADAQNRAREALARAEAAVKKDDEKQALSEASAAAALAGLAQANAELNRLTAERDQLAAR